MKRTLLSLALLSGFASLMNASNASPVVMVTANYTASSSDGTVLCLTSGGLTVTLPSSANTGQQIKVVNISGGGNTVTISQPPGGDIDNSGSNVYTLPANGGSNLPTSMTFQYTPGNPNSWWIVQRSPTN